MGFGSLFKAVVKIAVMPITVPVAIAKDTLDHMGGDGHKESNIKNVVESIADDLDDIIN